MAAHMKKTEWDNIPEWAIYALEYGTEEDGSLNEEERAMIEKFVGTHFPKGYTERIPRCSRKLPGSMDYRTMGHSRLGKLEKKIYGKTYPDGI